MIFNLTPIGKPRMTRRDRWKKRPCVVEYFAYRDTILLQARGWTPSDEPELIFDMPMPRSWSGVKKAKMLGQPHQQRPDLDNLVKGFLDCFGEDKHVWHLLATKVWATEGRIVAG